MTKQTCVTFNETVLCYKTRSVDYSLPKTMLCGKHDMETTGTTVHSSSINSIVRYVLDIFMCCSIVFSIYEYYGYFKAVWLRFTSQD